jgi:hypothetical protein
MRNIYSILLSATTLLIVLFSNVCISQTLELGILSSLEVYTSSGAVTSNGTVTGNVGTNSGVISGSGFGSDYTGTVYESDAVTAEARIDVLRVFIHLSEVFVTHPGSHAPAFGDGETITAGVYSIPGNGFIGGTLTLDGGGDPDAFFILKFAGALVAGAGSTVVLSGGTQAANVFWIANGAISVGANSVLKGTLLSHPGAISLGANCSISGRLISSEGCLTIGDGCVVGMPEGTINIPIKCIGLCSPTPTVDVLGSVNQYALFSSAGAVANTSTSGIVGDIGSNAGAISGFGTSAHVGFFKTPDSQTEQAMQDLDYAYSQLMALTNTELGHTAAFGSGETVLPGVYFIGGAGSLAGSITLDAQEDPEAIFVFKIGGAFSVAAQSKVIFSNGTSSCNVFWIAEGAISIGASTSMKGTAIAHNGACSMGANGNLEGRLLSTAGAIGFSTGVVYIDALCFEESEPLSDGDQEVCSDETTTQTITAAASNPSSTNQNMVWYDAPIGGDVVNPPSQVGIGTITYYAESFNGAYSSQKRVSVTLTVKDCNIVIEAIDDSYIPVQAAYIVTNVGNVTMNDILDGVAVTDASANVTPIATEPLSIDVEGVLSLDANTGIGIYSITYQLCEEGVNSLNCTSATATVEVDSNAIGSCAGDYNFSGRIDIQDMLIFLTDFGCMSGCLSDLNNDNLTNAPDMLIFLALFGTNCPKI